MQTVANSVGIDNDAAGKGLPRWASASLAARSSTRAHPVMQSPNSSAITARKSAFKPAGGSLAPRAQIVAVQHCRILAIGESSTMQDCFAQPPRFIRDLKDDAHLVLLPVAKDRVVGFRDAPFDRPVQNRLSIGLLGVQGLHGVSEVMTQDSCGVRCVRVTLFPEVPLHPVIPLVGDTRCAAPVSILDVDDVVLKVAKTRVGVFCARQVPPVMMQEQRGQSFVPHPSEPLESRQSRSSGACYVQCAARKIESNGLMTINR